MTETTANIFITGAASLITAAVTYFFTAKARKQREAKADISIFKNTYDLMKVMVDDLTLRVRGLSEEIEVLRSDNTQLRKQASILVSEIRFLEKSLKKYSYKKR